LRPTHRGRRDPLIAAFNSQEKVFQLHGYTFDLPRDAELLVTGEQVANQAFRIKQNIYGFQFHLEANLPLIKRWLKMPPHDKEIAQLYKGLSADDLWQESLHAVSRSQALSQTVFERFLDLVPKVHTRYQFVHRHFKLQPSLMA
jgi:GMP synthase (glutamine-hydrolysing)